MGIEIWKHLAVPGCVRVICQAARDGTETHSESQESTMSTTSHHGWHWGDALRNRPAAQSPWPKREPVSTSDRFPGGRAFRRGPGEGIKVQAGERTIRLSVAGHPAEWQRRGPIPSVAEANQLRF